MLHERGRDLEDEFDLLLDDGVVMLHIGVVVVVIVVQQLHEHVRQLLRATALLDVRANQADLVLQGLAVAKDGMQQLLQRKPEIVEKVAVEHAVLALLKRLNVERPRIGIVVEPMARFLDQIGRASGRERVWKYVSIPVCGYPLKKKNK